MIIISNFYVAHSTSAAGQEIYFIGVTSLPPPPPPAGAAAGAADPNLAGSRSYPDHP